MDKNYIMKQWMKIGGITLAVCLVLFGAAFLGFKLSNIGKINSANDPVATQSAKEKSKKKKEEEEIFTQNIAVFGVDKDEMLTDVIMVVHLDSTSHKIKALSIPRDTKVIWDIGLQQKLKEVKPDFEPSSSTWVTKLNEVAATGGTRNSTIENNVKTLTIYQLERMLGISIDNYVIVNLEAFRRIVDAIGGVEVDVPQRMYYTDNSQGLYIDLKPGLQTLDGEHAEMLIRYRRYLNGDVDRIKVQQLFLKALAQKVMSPQIVTKVPKIVPVMFESVKTDISLMDIPKYYTYLENLNTDNISFHSLPGIGAMENGLSYFFVDERALRQVLAEVFYDAEPLEEEIKITMPNISEGSSQEEDSLSEGEESLSEQGESLDQTGEGLSETGETLPQTTGDMQGGGTLPQTTEDSSGEGETMPQTSETKRQPEETTSEPESVWPEYIWPESVDTWPTAEDNE